MLKMFAVMGRDLRSYVNAFSFYLMVAFFLGIAGYFFWSTVCYFSLVSFQAATNPATQPSHLNLTEGVFSPFLLNVSVLLLLLVPILTMRSFAEERKMGTLELLFTYPVSNLQILFGKFFAILTLLFFLFLPTVVYFPLARIVGAHFELDSFLSGYLGLFLVGASFTSLGIFISSLTDNQAVSAGIGFVILLFFWIAGWVADWSSPALGSIFRELSLIDHFRDFTRGVIDTRDIAYFILFTLFFLFTTLCAIEVRTWKR